ncbi:transcription initiation factor TFIID subunit 4-like isoform X2 [Syngnathus scovelli]|uniref:transcription initiation factor TFIID subunit 4-like isoform X2 n=1 Tax=Syngnathus scovelli TaxID=161590 RepID=UPI00210F9B21|nr:transcription initiation factor TFIID subunit 4B-like isoform X2 [Syngnathus scovelli]
MATNKDPMGTAGDEEPTNEVKTLQVTAKCGLVPSPGVSKGEVYQPTSSVQAPQMLSPAVMMVTKVSKPGSASANCPKAVLSQATTMNSTSVQGRTVVITVPRSAGPQVPVAPRPAPTQLPANIQIPPGMMLIRSGSGQLMLMSQQAFAQAQQGARTSNSTATGILAPQASTPGATGRSNEKVTVIRMTAPAPQTLQPTALQKPMVKVIGVTPKPASVQTRGVEPEHRSVTVETMKEPPPTFSQETLESVKKCKNFLVTLMKLASSDSKSADMANNVRGLVRTLLEGRIEAEEFTEALYRELKSTPQPCLVPFLKFCYFQKSLPAVRRLTADPQVFVQQACSSSSSSSSSSSPLCGPAVKKPNVNPAPSLRSLYLASSGTGVSTQFRALTSKNLRVSSTPKVTPVQIGKNLTGGLSMTQAFAREPPCATKLAFRDHSASYKEDDDINDVASMAGVNLREENAQILTSAVGSVVQSCQDQLFLSPGPVLGRILCTGRPLGVSQVGPEAVALVSHAAQEYLRGLLQKLRVMAEHRKRALKDDPCQIKVSDVRSQLHFLEEVDTLRKKRQDEEERDKMMRLARSRSHTEDPLQQQLKQRAKELQQMEEAQQQKREANLTALAAIGPRKKRPISNTEGQVSLAPRQAVHRVSRVMLRDLLVCMEQDQFLRRSLTFYKAML